MVALVDSLFGPNPLHAPAQRATALDEYTRLARLPYLIELIGGLALEDAITPRVVYTLWAGGIPGAWEGWEEAVRQLRDPRERVRGLRQLRVDRESDEGDPPQAARAPD